MEEKIAYLNGPSARLLLVLLLAKARGETRMKAGEMKRMAGVETSRYWSGAIAQLEQFGLAHFTKEGHHFRFTTSLSLNGFGSGENERQKETNREIDSLSIYRTSDAEAADRDAGDQLLADLGVGFGSKVPFSEKGSIVPYFGEGAEEKGSKVPFSGDYGSIVPFSDLGQKSLIPEKGSIVPNLRSECIQVDLMDDSGELGRANTPAQLRRREQVVIVQKTWTKFFPDHGELLAQNAKFFLSHLSNSAEAVYDYFEWLESMHKNNPLTYGRVVLENRAREGGTQVPASPAVPVRVPEPEPEQVSEEEWQRRERVVQRQMQKRIQELKRRGGTDEPGTQDF